MICKIRKTKLAYHPTTSDLKAHLSTLHPSKLEEEGGGLTFNKTLKKKKSLVCFSSENIIACLLTLTDTLPSGGQNIYNLILIVKIS